MSNLLSSKWQKKSEVNYGANLIRVPLREPLSLLLVGAHQDAMNALYLLGFVFVIGMMTCEGKQIAGSSVEERSGRCMVDVSGDESFEFLWVL
ncbi:hypothetical protein V5799_032087 [Amblyomma americanum]|uniref:Uncharacterized protein n=1 Tax=Amblyomma americanum TaxID=6943 RepID=A0AAQ4DS65_AMBAM